VRWCKILHLTGCKILHLAGYDVSDAVRTTLALDISMSNKSYSFCLMVEASDHRYVLRTRRIHVTRYRIRYDMI
jgi:hypothetical protein